MQHTTNKKGSTKAANGRRKEERAGFEESLTPDQLCETQKIKRDQQKTANVQTKEKRGISVVYWSRQCQGNFWES